MIALEELHPLFDSRLLVIGGLLFVLAMAVFLVASSLAAARRMARYAATATPFRSRWSALPSHDEVYLRHAMTEMGQAIRYYDLRYQGAKAEQDRRYVVTRTEQEAARRAEASLEAMKRLWEDHMTELRSKFPELSATIPHWSELSPAKIWEEASDGKGKA